MTDKLPSGWVRSTLGECFSWGSGGTPLSSEPRFYGGEIPWLIIGDLNDGVVATSSVYITEDGLRNSSAKWIEPGSVLLAMYGSIGKVAIAGVPLTTNQAIAFAKTDPIVSRYLFYYLKFKQRDLESLGKGATQKNISQTVIRSFPFIVAPLPEQRRIVAKIEELFSDLDAGVAALERVKATLAKYKASVLKAAVEGRLTEEWREEHPDVEPASVLLERILKERRAKWEEEQLAKYEAKGQKPPNGWREKYKEPVAPDASGLPCLPKGWCWAAIEHLAWDASNGFGTRHQEEGSPVPVLRLADIVNGCISLGAVREINATSDEVRRYRLEPDDLLVIRVNGSPDLVGRVVLYSKPRDAQALFCDHFIRLRVGHNLMARWIRLWSDSHFARRYVEKHKVSSAGQNTVSQTSLAAMPIPLPAVEELELLVTLIEDSAPTIAMSVTATESASARSRQLRQSILNRTFEGKLVPQDPSDEPTSVLLERIRAERVSVESASPARKRVTRKKLPIDDKGLRHISLPLETSISE